ncbi:protein of unknown function DUF490 [Thermosinus carboxydivorans Nor1]|uniref:Translocation and assembly module TamB C-terminal domain-containing protein n=1 Tax=Thermosinus carboxydivorans Nor1 TaxID=401526 RepID=A1HRF9_9FIRM|nr:translocation/assembly module TamB domain-containing protein [Thermosinus carboxydivorans]EAX47474.1 protein of unknown function DUF490 [Thermosinus carboxydivorans Nor1]
MRQKSLVLLLIAAAIMVIAAGLWGSGRSQAVLARMQDKVAEELGRAAGGRVTFARVEVTGYNKLSFYDVAVYDARGERLAASERVTVTISLTSMLSGHFGPEAVTSVTLERPLLELIQHHDGRWNVEQFLDRPGRDGSACRARITLEDGTVSMRSPQGAWQAEKVSGTIDFVHNPTIFIKLDSTVDGAKVTAEGTLNTDGQGVVRLTAAEAPLTRLAALAPAGSMVKLTAGTAQDIMLTVRRDGQGLTYAGEARIAGAALDIDGIPIRDGSALLTITPQYLYLYKGKATIHGQTVTVHGRIALATSEPVLDLAVASAAFDPAALGYEPLQGPLAFKLTVAGTAANPVVTGQAALRDGRIAGYPVTNLQTKIVLKNKVLTVTDGTVNAFGGRVAVKGTLDLTGQNYELYVTASGLDAGALPGTASRLSGRIEGDFFVAGQAGEMPTVASGTVVVQGGQAAGIPFAELKAGLYKSGEQITLDYMNIKTGQGLLTASGKIAGQALDLAVCGYQAPLSALAPVAFGLLPDGTADFSGTVTGTLDRPEASITFTATNGRVLHQPFRTATGGLKLHSGQLVLDNIVAASGPAVYRISGTISLTGEQAVNLTVTTRQVRAENLILLVAPGERLTGNVDSDFVLTGPASNPNAAGTVTLTEGSFRGQLIAKAVGRFHRQDGVTIIDDALIHSLNTEIRLSGRVDANNELNIKLAAQDIDLARFNYGLPYPVTGRATFSGTLSGPASAPVFYGEVTAAKLVLAEREVENVRGIISVNAGRIHIPHFGFSQAQGTFAFSGTFDLNTRWVDGSLDVTNGDLAGILAVVRVPAKGIEGRLDGHVMVNGAADRPNIAVTGKLRQGKLRNYPLDSVDLDVELTNNILTIHTFTAQQGTGILAARGVANLDGPLNLEIGGRDIDAGLLTAWFDAAVTTKGKLSFAAQVSGTARHPHTAVSMEIAGGQLGSATFDSLYGLFILDNGSIRVDQILLTKGPYRASAYGVIPLAALSQEGRSQASVADQMDLRLRLEQANLSILPLLTREVAWAAGETKGELTIGGTLAEPTLRGQILVKNGAIKLASLAEPIQNVAVDIQFDGDKINIKTFDGQMGGGSYRLAGALRLQGMALADYDLLLVLDHLGISHKYFHGPLNGTLTLTSRGGTPFLSGRLLFENAEIDIPLVPEFAAADWDLGLDVELVAGNKVRLHNPYMYDILVTGRAKFAGSVRQPAASGRFEAIRGTVSYLRTIFRLKEARAEFTQYGSFEPVIHLSAETRLERTQVLLDLHGPVTSMEMRLTAVPAMSQQEILSLLTLRSRYFDKQKSASTGRDAGLDREEVMSLLDAGLQMRFIAEMEDAFRRAFGLDEFRVVRGTLAADGRTDKNATDKTEQELYTDREVYNIEVSKYVNDRLMLSYTLGVGHNERTMGFRYDLTRRFSITGSVDEQNHRRFGLETRFRF